MSLQRTNLAKLHSTSSSRGSVHSFDVEYGNGFASFKQQNLKAIQPVLSPLCVIVLLLCIFMFFVPIGILLEECSERIIEYSKRYDNIEECAVNQSMNYTQLPIECTVDINISQNMHSPIYFYYGLKNFYQNHRKFIQSKSDVQLRNEGNDEVSKCEPLISNSDNTIFACGLIANSMFEDRFSASIIRDDITKDLCPNCENYGKNNIQEWRQKWHTWHTESTWQMSGIAWTSDMDSKFIFDDSSISVDSDNTQIGIRQNISGLRLPDVDNEDFVVWMRTAALTDFRKLHRIMKEDALIVNDVVRITILNWYPVTEFGGEKWVILSNSEWCGTNSSQQYSLSVTYIVVGCIAIALVVVFAVLLLCPRARTLADVDIFTWHNRPLHNRKYKSLNNWDAKNGNNDGGRVNRPTHIR